MSGRVGGKTTPSLLASGIMLCLCLSLLLSTTYAWATSYSSSLRGLAKARTIKQHITGVLNEQESDAFAMDTSVDIKWSTPPSSILENSPRRQVSVEIAEKILQNGIEAMHGRGLSSLEKRAERLCEVGMKWKKHETDSGSAQYQVARLNERIRYLTTHMVANRKDFAAKRGLTAIVTARRKLLDYIFRDSPEKAVSIAAELGIRFRPQNRIRFERAVKYAAFKNTKQRRQDAKAKK